ncbi:3-(cis-5,6-dihydroxycyclohexa-1,3-dien-1-yl)propanoate dehydrogenase [Gordonia jinghuaiqii]|uniref:3-(Cis-5,6-dihydroxycyclohexa-1, 3-dien-1-yl)propanoate dehydrogenase n=1 Tax=Gordonia jinghuaiqii TaxID=2758710 RepID=A0A7D7QGQ4_9ACTN|nr:3-(cis-5,6-dihydroxycyclohexa-1,3-dien-1-yl)propanoate dehydrogenase [Gordonia jinghuaiqii]MCR5978829.1 3-(cis-5,6-dihydroxycyclohexa-1,3-dien-1-yl)propanoate dehydrogenase [Gordonia jinghuaiqii]QMT01822.1 3-(cis-5,6-dihydroxycyclohexa-1,3-dien-1-yl)propanoate dehydrogenase [Gordonia jinghuaiqii]
MSGWLEGKRALIVGGGSGIGRAVIDAFGEEGARVGVLEISEHKCGELAAEHPEVLVVRGDATTAAANEAAVAAMVGHVGGLDILVNCVGVFDFYRKLADIDADAIDSAFDEMFSINVRSHLHSVKAAMGELTKSKGNVVLTESTSSYYPGRGGTLYVASKFAVRGLVTTLAYELAPDVRVNSVAPGGTLNTDLRGLSSLGITERRLDGPDRAAELAGRTPLAVALSGTDHAWGYVFLASDRARGITGRVVHSDGGMGIKV